MDGDIQPEREKERERGSRGLRAALTLFAAISTGASFTPVHAGGSRLDYFIPRNIAL